MSVWEESGQLCWGCKNACGGCEWSRKLEPVPGWKAKKVLIGVTPPGKKGYMKVENYKVISCPKFEPDERE